MSKHPSKRGAVHSRTDRFTQMSKQEEIIAEKKRLIEAKLKMIQSQEKTETQQSSTANKNAITAKQAVINSFSNDGSFLENFKKIASPTDAVPNVTESKIDKQQCDKMDRSFNTQDNYEGFKNNSHWTHHKREDDNSRNYDHNSYHPLHKSHLQNMHPKPSYDSGYSFENQNYQHNFNAQNNQRNTVFGNTCTPNYQMNQSIQNGRFKNMDNITNSSFPSYPDNMRNMSSWQGPNENSMGRISDYNHAAISGRDEMSPQKPVQIPALTSLQIPPPSSIKIAPETNVQIPPPLIKPDLSVPPPVAFSLLSIPEPKPIDTTTIPRPGPLNLHTIPPPMPMCINNIPKPKEIDVRTIPPPKQFNISGINLPSTTYHGNVFYGKNDPVLSADNLMSSQTQGSNHHSDSNQTNRQNPERNPIERVAKLIVEIGDGYEETFKQKHQHEPEFWFLFRQDSAEYSKLKELVRKLKEEKNEKNSYSPEELYEPEFSLNDDDDDDDFSTETSPENVKTDNKQITFKKSLVSSCYDDVTEPAEENLGKTNESESEESRKRRKRKSRWGNEQDNVVAQGLQSFIKSPNLGAAIISLPPDVAPLTRPLPPTQINKVTRTDKGLLQYAKNTFGTTNLSEEDWIKAEDHFKINLLYQEMLRKRKELDQLSRSGKHKYEYDSDEEVDGGTWEHKLRSQEMEATQKWADELTKKSEGKHHIGDFLPPEELKKFMEKYSAAKNGREPDISDYKEYKLNENNVGFQMLQKLGWKDGEGLGSSGSGIVEPINKATNRESNQGLGLDRPDNILTEDNEYDAYRKRMMLAYRFRPNPLNNPRRPYY